MGNRTKYPADFISLEYIPQDIRYATRHNFTGRPLPGYIRPKAILRETVAAALGRVQISLLPQGFSLYIYDAYRPQRAVNAMVQWAEETAPSLLARDYIARRSNHSRGIAVDLTLAQVSKIRGFVPVDMGTCFDCFCELSHTWSQDVSTAQIRLRELLVSEMERQGFMNYEREWWHFTYMDRRFCGIYYDFAVR